MNIYAMQQRVRLWRCTANRTLTTESFSRRGNQWIVTLEINGPQTSSRKIGSDWRFCTLWLAKGAPSAFSHKFTNIVRGSSSCYMFKPKIKQYLFNSVGWGVKDKRNWIQFQPATFAIQPYKNWEMYQPDQVLVEQWQGIWRKISFAANLHQPAPHSKLEQK